MTRATVAGEDFDLDAADVENAVADVDPEPIREHYVVIGRRRYPPKQVLALVTGLDRADFTTHQARSILRRLGFGVLRKGQVPPPRDPDKASWPHQGAEAALLEPYMGRFIAQDGLEVLYDGADAPAKALGVAGTGTTARMVSTLLTVGEHTWEAEVGFCDPWPRG